MAMLSGPMETELEIAQGVEVQTGAAVSLAARSEIEAQLDAAHKYERSLARFRRDATTMATLSREVAESCMYALPRGGKSITGPSVRLAEICASAWGNLQIGSRVVEVTETEVVAQGVAWDLQSNLRVTIEARRRITGKNGRRYDDDMIVVTGMAAQSVALRNAIFRVVPRGLVDTIYAAARAVAVGDARTLEARRAEAVARLAKAGVSADRVLAAVGVGAVEDIGLAELETLTGLMSSVRAREITLDDAFPAPLGSVPQQAPRAAALTERLRRPPSSPSVMHDADGQIVETPPSR